MVRKYKYSMFVVLFIELIIILVVAWKKPPVMKGDAEYFWCLATGVKIGEYEPYWLSDIYDLFDGKFVYTICGLEHEDVFLVDSQEAVSVFPSVVEVLDNRISDDPNEFPASTYTVWSNHRDEIVNDPIILIDEYIERSLQWGRENNNDCYSVGQKWVRDKCEQAHSFWLNILFEYLLFAGITLFMFWPLLCGKGVLRALCHLGFFPFMIFLPYYFGYAPASFILEGINGGVVYPWVLNYFDRFYRIVPFDGKIAGVLSDVLLLISQETGWTSLAAVGTGNGEIASTFVLGLIWYLFITGVSIYMNKVSLGKSRLQKFLQLLFILYTAVLTIFGAAFLIGYGLIHFDFYSFDQVSSSFYVVLFVALPLSIPVCFPLFVKAKCLKKCLSSFYSVLFLILGIIYVFCNL